MILLTFIFKFDFSRNWYNNHCLIVDIHFIMKIHIFVKMNWHYRGCFWRRNECHYIYSPYNSDWGSSQRNRSNRPRLAEFVHCTKLNWMAMTICVSWLPTNNRLWPSKYPLFSFLHCYGSFKLLNMKNLVFEENKQYSNFILYPIIFSNSLFSYIYVYKEKCI